MRGEVSRALAGKAEEAGTEGVRKQARTRRLEA